MRVMDIIEIWILSWLGPDSTEVRKRDSSPTPIGVGKSTVHPPAGPAFRLLCASTVLKNIYPSIFYTRLFRRSGRRGAGADPSGHQARGLSWTGHQSITGPHRDNWDKQTPKDNFRVNNQPNMQASWLVGGSQNTQREPTHTQGEQANSTLKGPRWGLNLEPSRCEATVLTTTPPCSPILKTIFCKFLIL